MIKPIVSVVIVTYNSVSLVDRCLAPIYDRPEIEIVVVDNASSDGTADRLEALYPRVILVRSAMNLGFAAGNNIGFERCSADYVLLLNPDAFLDGHEQIFELIGEFERDPGLAFVGPQLRNEDGTHQTGDAGWADTLLATAGHMLFLHRLSPYMPALHLTNKSLIERPFVEVDWVCGACLLTRRSVIDAIGGLSTDFFMYGEDVEWGERARNLGYRVLYVPGVVVLHLQGATQRRENGVFFSTRWLEARAKKWARRTRFRFEAFRTIVLTGFAVRWACFAGACLLDRRKYRGRREAFAKYVKFCFAEMTYRRFSA